MFSNRYDEHLPATIGTDQRFKRLTIDGREASERGQLAAAAAGLLLLCAFVRGGVALSLLARCTNSAAQRGAPSLPPLLAALIISQIKHAAHNTSKHQPTTPPNHRDDRSASACGTPPARTASAR